MILPILEPAISQKRARLLFFSFFSRTSLTRWEPLRAMTAMSEVGSRMGITAWLCLVKEHSPVQEGRLGVVHDEHGAHVVVIAEVCVHLHSM